MQATQIPSGVEELRLIDQHVGQRLRASRESLDISPEELSGYLRLSTTLLRRYEAGEVSIPASDLYEAAEFLGVRIGFFYEDLNLGPESETKSAPNHRTGMSSVKNDA